VSRESDVAAQALGERARQPIVSFVNFEKLHVVIARQPAKLAVDGVFVQQAVDVTPAPRLPQLL
jgi:hypothetical protein